jgi:hypothetical protein
MTTAYEPIREGDLSREGVNIHYRVFGTGEVTLLFAPPWIVAIPDHHARRPGQWVVRSSEAPVGLSPSGIRRRLSCGGGCV